jgi:hypothetical protein
MRLGERLQRNGFNLSNASVVFIKHKYAPHMSVKPQVTRTPHLVTRWVFHAILISDGIVYDLDYSTKARPIKLTDYLNTMWIKDELRDYVFQIKPYYKYERSDFGGRFNREDYPEVNIENFLKAIPTQ